MNKKLFLTSILAMVFIAPAMALVPPGGHDVPIPQEPEPEPEPEQPPLPDYLLYMQSSGGYLGTNCPEGFYFDTPAAFSVCSPCDIVPGKIFYLDPSRESGYYCPGVNIDELEEELRAKLYYQASSIGRCRPGEIVDLTKYDGTEGSECRKDCGDYGYDSTTGLCDDGGVFPSSGLMKENKTYFNAATSTNMDGVYSGSVNAVAEYDLINYVLSAGQYLPADSETPTTCPAGSYCSGIGTVQYNANTNQGIQSCPSGYALSVAGASSQNQCYRECTTSDIDAVHSTGVSGNYYYGDNNQCEPTGCVKGWHIKSASSSSPAMCEATDYMLNAGKYLPADSETPTTCLAGSYCSGIGNVQYNETSDQGIQSCPTGYTLSADGASSANECYRTCTTSDVAHSATVTGEYYYGDNNQCEPTGCENGYHYKAGFNLEGTIGQVEGTSYAYINNSSSFKEEYASHGATYYGLTNKNTWATDYGDKGMLTGQARCSSIYSGTPIPNLTDETGQTSAKYCYCNVTGYKPEGGTLQSLSAPWVLNINSSDAGYCANFCAYYCASYMRKTSYLAFRAALLGTVQSYPAICEANTITINWKDVDETTAGQNDEGTATYGGDVRTPFKAETKPGKRFLGWIFSKPEQTNLPE